jgi:hypothetical protein
MSELITTGMACSGPNVIVPPSILFVCLCFVWRTDNIYSFEMKIVTTIVKGLDSISDEVFGYFNFPNPSSRTITLKWTQS